MNSNLHSQNHSLPKSYIKGDFLGSGGFATVYEFTNTDTKIMYAGKLIEKKSVQKNRNRQKLISEIKIHKSLSHPHIVNFYSNYEDEENICLILELCKNQSLSELLKRRKRISEKETQYYVYQLLLAVKYLHGLKILHRDIKLGNLLLTENMEVKLGDFGLATKLEYEGERKRTICGTPNYIAPEVLEGSHCYEADIWSIGVSIYTLLIGYPPFQTSNIKSTYQKIKSSLYSFPGHLHVSVQAKDLLGQVFVSDPNNRISLDGIFLHDFFTRNEIPVHIPVSSLVVPPSDDTLKQFCADFPEEICDLSTSSSEENALSVEKWVVISGTIGYLLSNTLIGAVFEDGSKIIGNSQEFIFVDDKIHKCTYQKYPGNIKAKVAFLRYCVQFFRIFSKEPLKNPVYVKKGKEQKHVIFFKLSNKTLQFCFTDKSQILIVKSTQDIIYHNKHEEKSQYPFSLLSSLTNKDLITRLRYTHSILKSIN